MSAPRQIIMVRHGQSAANQDQSIYNRIPDYRIPLTEVGVEQARKAGERIRRQLDGQKVAVYVSPYLRAYQTLEALELGELVDRTMEEPRLREQDWANFQNPAEIADQKELRNAYGHFFYRFREGESGSDVYDRVSSFLETLHRRWSEPDFAPNTLLVTHGLTMRLFCMRWFHWSVEYFESLNNPGNADVRTLVESNGRYSLDVPFDQWTPAHPGTTVMDAPLRF
ncbi:MULTISPECIES: histidine phosphatase family protein [unclassified Arthrobacter]|uniref:histidine phosphatase family protein n=1 Tax=unclassified Arthrobacter TaxID=235627 RepID=UPI00159E4139|nr:MULTISPECIES: histidine phosphatase family protein [unclassified Arthrobacter]MCQ9163444.1 histidine phosphatase family protein [Arthrobacter sp. STN4]NVM97642.1 histidine phosphatase family protein [Arthrobacter sp. SDTb3-6]